MAWWSLTCNIAREWRLMMAEARAEVATRSVLPRRASATTKSSVSTLAKPSESAENGGWARAHPVLTPSGPMWST